MKNQTVYLGSLGLMEYFRLPGSSVRYRTITYAPMNTIPYNGVRDVLNMEDLKAKCMFCKTKVVRIVPRGNEVSELSI